MTQEEIRKLLGGYANDTLTELERTALFEAALEDQGLFDALQNEDALRELLADPVAREQVRQALQPAAAERRRILWMPRAWLIGAASVAVASVIAIGIVTWHREPARPAAVPLDQLAQSRTEPKVEAPQPSLAVPAPAIPAPVRKRAAREQTRPAQLASGVIGGLAIAPLDANAPLYSGPLVRYSVLRGGPSGDGVRIEVVSQVAGSLTLYRADAAGQWQQVYPANGPGIFIVANAPYQIPDDPIAIRGNHKKLRLVIEPATRPTAVVQLGTGSPPEPRSRALPKAAAATAAPAPAGPLVVEIPIGPN
jgi:hypothetical protein